jgi:hypothetical protein
LRTPNGSFTTVEPSGSLYAQIAGLSANQTVAGSWVDPSNLVHGFTSLNGTTTSFDAPNSTATFANNINAQGTIAGDYYDTSGVSRGYLRSPGGTFSEFSIPGAGTSSGQGTIAGESNAKGQITGYYLDSRNRIGTAGPERWRIWAWLGLTLCKRKPLRERLPILPAVGRLPLTRIFFALWKDADPQETGSPIASYQSSSYQPSSC